MNVSIIVKIKKNILKLRCYDVLYFLQNTEKSEMKLFFYKLRKIQITEMKIYRKELFMIKI